MVPYYSYCKILLDHEAMQCGVNVNLSTVFRLAKSVIFSYNQSLLVLIPLFRSFIYFVYLGLELYAWRHIKHN